jgi:hypothetical protein
MNAGVISAPAHPKISKARLTTKTKEQEYRETVAQQGHTSFFSVNAFLSMKERKGFAGDEIRTRVDLRHRISQNPTDFANQTRRVCFLKSCPFGRLRHPRFFLDFNILCLFFIN